MTTPQRLLAEIHWSFSEPVPRSPAALVDAARLYAASIEAPDPTTELRTVLPFTDVRIVYDHPVRGLDGEWLSVEDEVRVMNASRARLTGAEVLWELHGACAATVGESDGHYFEGLALEQPGVGMSPPVYRVELGS